MRWDFWRWGCGCDGLRSREQGDGSRRSLAFTALYFTHLLGFGIAGLIVVAYLALSRRPLRDWLWSGALALPGLAFYLHSSRVGLSASKIVFHGWEDKLDSLGMILHGYWPWLDWISLAALAAWFLAAWWRNPEFRWDRKWLAIAAFLFALFWVIPWMWGEGSDLDIRVLPFLFVAILATARVGRRAKLLAAIPLLLFAARTVSVTRHFKEAQPALAGLARSFDAVPRGALVLPIVEGDEDPIERPFTHFWAYGVIRRGWFSPYLMDAPGETPMRIIHDSYTPDGFWNLVYDEAPGLAAGAERLRLRVGLRCAADFPRPLRGSANESIPPAPLEVYRIRKSPVAQALLPVRSLRMAIDYARRMRNLNPHRQECLCYTAPVAQDVTGSGKVICRAADRVLVASHMCTSSGI